MKTRLAALLLLSSVAASADDVPILLPEDVAPAAPPSAATPASVPAPVLPAPATQGCLSGEALSPEHRDRLNRFASLPVFATWERSDCWPPLVGDEALTGSEEPVSGAIVNVAGHDAVLVDLGLAWLNRCAGSGLAAAGADPMTGDQLAILKRRVAATPAFAELDIREIGFGRGHTRDKRQLWAMVVGDLRRSVFVECQEDVPEMLDKGAAALRGG